jgi:hypothetical protein
MKPFDYEKFLKNNPLLKESINEATLKDLIKPLVAKLESMGYEVDSDPTPGFQTLEAYKTYPDESILRLFLMPSDKEVDQRRDMPDDNRGLSDYTTLDVSFTYWPVKVTKKFFGLYKSKQRVMQDLPDEAGRNIDLGIGMFDIPVEDSVNRIIGVLKKAEQKVAGGTPTRQMTGDPDTDFLGEAKEKEKDIEIDIDSAEQITLKGKELDSDKLGTNKKYRDLILKAPDKAFMYKGKPASITAVDLNDGSEDEPKIYLTIINEAIGQENNYKKAALEIVALAKAIIKAAEEQLSMHKEIAYASRISDADQLSDLYYHLLDELGDFLPSGMDPFKNGAKKIIVDKYNIEMTDEYGYPMKWR